jgi:ribose transport system ATP-binding protein
VLELRHISKSFPGVRALDDVSLTFNPGEIHALVGENGAGKSTTIKIITGIYQPDGGEILFEGKPLHCKSYHDSLKMGIDIVYQEIQIVPGSSIAENIMLDKLSTHGNTGIVNWRAINETAKRYMDLVGLDLDPKTPMRRLSAARKQLAQIAKALAANAKVLLLDEPTSSLSEYEANNLFKLLRQLRDEGRTLIFVSHKFDEVYAICDRVSVLRDGRCVGSARISDIPRNDLIKMMIGHEFKEERLGQMPTGGATALRVENLSQAGQVKSVSFSVKKGEILGFYGLVGSGRTETAKLVIGDEHRDSGAIFVNEQPAQIRNVGDALYRYGIGYVTENRKEEGLLLKSSVRTNLTIGIWQRIANALSRCISSKKELEIARKMVVAMAIKTPTLSQRVENLSGGNQQKVSIGKWLAADCDILFIDEPSVGVDIGAKDQIHRLIWSLAAKENKAIILISSDMPEMIKLAGRILVFKEGEIVGQIEGVDAPDATYEKISHRIGALLN